VREREHGKRSVNESRGREEPRPARLGRIDAAGVVVRWSPGQAGKRVVRGGGRQRVAKRDRGCRAGVVRAQVLVHEEAGLHRTAIVEGPVQRVAGRIRRRLIAEIGQHLHVDAVRAMRAIRRIGCVPDPVDEGRNPAHHRAVGVGVIPPVVVPERARAGHLGEPRRERSGIWRDTEPRTARAERADVGVEGRPMHGAVNAVHGNRLVLERLRVERAGGRNADR